jgi:hypothetical protein
LHALNNLYQRKEAPAFSREELDIFAKRIKKEGGSSLADVSLYDKYGNYLMEVLVTALKTKYGIELEPIEKTGADVRRFDGIICHSREAQHYVSMRRINGLYLESDSLKFMPVLIADASMEGKIKEMDAQGYTLYVWPYGARGLPPLVNNDENPGGDTRNWFKLSDIDILATPIAASGEKEDQAKSHERQLRLNLWLEMDFQSLRHRMAAHYYRHRFYWWELMPAATLTMTSGVLAFISTAEFISETAKEVIPIIIGCFSILATFLQTMGGFLAYSARRVMFEAAAEDIGALRDAIAFDEYEEKNVTKKGTTGTMNYYTYRNALDQAKKACRYDVPPLISSMLDHFKAQVCYILGYDHETIGRQHAIKRDANNAFWYEVARNRGRTGVTRWPIVIPADTILHALRRIEHLFEDDEGCKKRCKFLIAQCATKRWPNIHPTRKWKLWK